ncbi:hypothetical protein GX48_06925 [Paracoccidioides brasiliensis]|nr:hypothetical protein GX48_06925 [Paracoccidioides brasiliensis]
MVSFAFNGFEADFSGVQKSRVEPPHTSKEQSKNAEDGDFGVTANVLMDGLANWLHGLRKLAHAMTRLCMLFERLQSSLKITYPFVYSSGVSCSLPRRHYLIARLGRSCATATAFSASLRHFPCFFVTQEISSGLAGCSVKFRTREFLWLAWALTHTLPLHRRYMTVVV